MSPSFPHPNHTLEKGLYISELQQSEFLLSLYIHCQILQRIQQLPRELGRKKEQYTQVTFI